jgi:predicted dehydrogenase
VINAIRSDLKPLISGEEALKSVQIIRAIYESSSGHGKIIQLG